MGPAAKIPDRDGVAMGARPVDDCAARIGSRALRWFRDGRWWRRWRQDWLRRRRRRRRRWWWQRGRLRRWTRRRRWSRWRRNRRRAHELIHGSGEARGCGGRCAVVRHPVPTRSRPHRAALRHSAPRSAVVVAASDGGARHNPATRSLASLRGGIRCRGFTLRPRGHHTVVARGVANRCEVPRVPRRWSRGWQWSRRWRGQRRQRRGRGRSSASVVHQVERQTRLGAGRPQSQHASRRASA